MEIIKETDCHKNTSEITSEQVLLLGQVDRKHLPTKTVPDIWWNLWQDNHFKAYAEASQKTDHMHGKADPYKIYHKVMR